MPRIALGLGNGRALPGGVRGCVPLSLPYFRGPDCLAPTPPHPRREFPQAGWVGLQVSRGLVA